MNQFEFGGGGDFTSVRNIYTYITALKHQHRYSATIKQKFKSNIYF